MKRFIATLALLAGLTHAAPITMLDVPDNTALYDSTDPFAIGVSTAAYTSATNATARLDAMTLALGISAATATNISTYVTAQHANRTDNPHGVTAVQIGAITNESDSIALSALSTNRVTRLFDSTGTRWIDGTGGVWQISVVTNYTIYNQGMNAYYVAYPAWTSTNFPFADGTFSGVFTNDIRVLWAADVGWRGSQVSGPPFTFPATLSPVSGLFHGTAIVSQNVYSVTSALPRVAFADDIPSTNGLLSATGDGSGLTGITAAQVGAATASITNGLATTNYVNAMVASNTTVPRAWMPLTTHNQFGHVDLNAASNSTITVGPAPLNSFIIRPLIMGADGTYSNIVFYCSRSLADPRLPQGFTSATTGVFTVKGWGMPSPTGYVMRRNDSLSAPGYIRKNIVAYSLGMAGTVPLMCLWSPATDAELADADGIIEYANDAR